jgi:capsule polysaccharide export protein KpsE/RkpR
MKELKTAFLNRLEGEYVMKMPKKLLAVFGAIGIVVLLLHEVSEYKAGVPISIGVIIIVLVFGFIIAGGFISLGIRTVRVTPTEFISVSPIGFLTQRFQRSEIQDFRLTQLAFLSRRDTLQIELKINEHWHYFLGNTDFERKLKIEKCLDEEKRQTDSNK